MCCIIGGCIQSAPGVHSASVVPPGQMANGSGVNPVNRKNPMGKELHPETLQRVAMLIQEKAEMMRCLPDDMNVTKDTLVHVLECVVDLLIHMAGPVNVDKIIKDYHLAEGSKLVHHRMGPDGVDCWFDTNEVRQHRCLSYDDFQLIQGV